MKIEERHFLDQHDYRGFFDLIIMISGRDDEIRDLPVMFGLLEPYLNKWGFSCKDCTNRGRYEFYPEDGVARRILMYRKRYPPRYDKKSVVLFNQKYTPEVKQAVLEFRKKNQRQVATPIELT